MLRFKLFGVSIRIDFLFVALVCLFLILDKTGISTIALAVCFIHEMGHIIMFFLVGYKPKELAFKVTGISLIKPISALNYKKEVLVQLAGSGTNLIIFSLLCHTTNSISNVSIFAVTNLVIGVFNLLPLKNFDGGKLLEITLLRLFSISFAEGICTVIDLAFIFIMLTSSVYAFFTSQQSLTLIVITLYLMITALMKLNYKQMG